MTDEQLVNHHLAGDPEAFNRLADRYQERLQRLAQRMLGDRDDAQDALQEILLRLLRSLPGFAGQARFSTWLYRLAANTCIDYRRHRSRGAVTVPLNQDAAALAPQEDPDAHCEKEFREYVLDQALKALPEGQRLLVILRDREGLSYEQIADILSIEVGTLKSRLHRARGALRRLLEAGVTVAGYEGVGAVRMTPGGELI